MFWITFVLFVVTTILYDIFASGETQPWNDPQKLREENVKINGTANDKATLAERNI